MAVLAVGWLRDGYQFFTITNNSAGGLVIA